MDQALVAIIGTDPEVSALIGDRIYPGEVPGDEQLPAISYLLTNALEERALDDSLEPEEATYRIRAITEDKACALALRKVLRKALANYSGTLAGTRVLDITVTGQREEPQFNPERWSVITNISTRSHPINP